MANLLWQLKNVHPQPVARFMSVTTSSFPPGDHSGKMGSWFGPKRGSPMIHCAGFAGLVAVGGVISVAPVFVSRSSKYSSPGGDPNDAPLMAAMLPSGLRATLL